jgi:hypothetical protein
MKRLDVGIYDDGNGGLHLDVRELLRHHGYADTPENCEQIVRATERLAREQFGVKKVFVTNAPIRRAT